MELLLIVIIVQLGFVLSRLPKGKGASEESFLDHYVRERKKNAELVASQLRELRLRACSFTLWEPGRVFVEAGSPASQGRGVVIDSDDVWVLIECPAPFGAKGATQRLLRIEDVKSVAEIVG
ncbi:hypothetical protein [Gordonibacter sp. An230]|uniref:hypothetical protein n=1 Tax=Gordonibacter sp. An230 TaxID=1965592 RepID=UPI001EF496B3|nr:hypothetical protein [Gordonibacter sp. An230]